MVIQRFRPYFSGQGVQVEELCKALARRGVESTILTAACAPDAGVEEHSGYRIERLRCGPAAPPRPHLWSPVFAMRALARLWQLRERIDLVHVHALTDALYAARLFGRLRRAPVLFEMTLLGADDPLTVQSTQNLFPRLRYALYRGCDGYVAISPALARRYEEAGLEPKRLRMIPQGVDIERFSPVTDKRELRRRLGLPEEAPLLAFVGSLIERKGIDVLLAAWERVHRARPEARLLLVGRERFPEDPGAERFLERHLGRLDAAAAKHVLRVGVQDRTEAFLQAADAFVFPSRREGFGSAIIEAMACGLPCVVAEIPGITDYIFRASVPGGVVVPQEDPRAVAEAVLALLEDPARASATGRAARERAVEGFALERIAKSYLDFYCELLHRPAATP
jgi:glycosyltransferase involved in cell wall biosynthesis